MSWEDKQEQILDSECWWDAEAVVDAAESWRRDWKTEIARMPTNQLEAARRVGQAAPDLRSYLAAWNEFLFGSSEADDRGHRNEGAVKRDRQQRAWGQARLADDFIMALSRAAQDAESALENQFRDYVDQLPTISALRLKDRMRLRKARAFVDSVVTRMRAEQALGD